ncbi:MAG: hypothetical protein UV73_C0005G0063 [Candidatus Gottesmanbacteria bacterium GW2011_GWA2_43_14]|uniref:Glycosyltransferase 2-like domain-containing protein n=1 Tax=Candidatus Gottesmanbacteria bacterium GW2011_GWA2_43_14 TaxID=1618443 RepID=A0A0G1FRY5_9BACT|nr:MAG: hypothetical protein UV73_C0005G0063 [Candidatus Gottesmanbacteria bacterium GW2011_GWA2_43_14]
MSVSIIIPAYNEEKNLNSAVKGALWAVKDTVSDYELIIVDDGSVDRTHWVANKFARKNRKIKVIHHIKNIGFGSTFKDGIRNACKDYLVGFPGDYDTSEKSLRDLIKKASSADLIMTYNPDMSTRTWARRLFSKSFIMMMNQLFGLRLKYYNGSFICKTKLLKNLKLVSGGFAIYAEAKVRLLHNGLSYEEIPFKYLGRKFGKSKAVSINSVLQTLETMFILINDIKLKKDK